ncbi:MAG: orotate phosphoribosyltransferase [Ruminococcaceae bacterium]|nr:orotate phosphoribosyltransferase [Oscillospiraceae bacterium]
MESRAKTVYSKVNKEISMSYIPGHFATNHSHINYFIDLTELLTSHYHANLAAEVLADHYQTQPIDTIICMDDTQMIAAFLAKKLADSYNGINADKRIHVLIPEFNTNGQMIFRDNLQKMLMQKNVLLLISSATTGKTIKRSLECIAYYGGTSAGVAALFSATSEIVGVKVFSIFGSEDVPDYQTFSYRECPFCQRQEKIDALVNSNGYMKL